QPTQPVVDRIYEKLRQPALVDLEVDVEGLDVENLVPSTLPDLFIGEPVVLFGRYRGPLTGGITLRGRRGSDRIEIPVEIRAVRDEDTDGVRSMWARHRIDELELDPSLTWAPRARRDQVTETIIDLSLRHRVLTEHTAFVAVDHTRVVDGRSRETIVQGVDIPSGLAHEAVWGHVGPPPGRAGALGSIGVGSGSGYGGGRGAGFGGRGSRIPKIRYARAKVTGSLDRTIIRR